MKTHSTHIMKNYTCTLHHVVTYFFIVQVITLSQAFGQGKFVDGYIITNKKDTIHGFVRDENWATSPTRIAFKSLNGEVTIYSAEHINGFRLISANEIYKSKAIGLLDISMTHTYTLAPSFVSKDSARVFLQELVSGDRVSLFKFLDQSEYPRFFIEKADEVKELYYYPFHKAVADKTFLLVYDEYKKQLTRLSGDSKQFREPIPPYEEKQMKHYIESYNASFRGDSVRYQVESDRLTLDLALSAGIDSWPGSYIVKNKPTYGFGLRVNFPRKFRNRYFIASVLLTPGITPGPSSNQGENQTARTIEVGVGRYIGSGRIRPFLGFNASTVNRNYREDFVGLHAGISYNRLISLEVGHFANFYCILTKSNFFIQPRISLHYFASLSLKRNRMH